MGQNERWSDLWDSIEPGNRHRAIQLQTCFILQEQRKMTLKIIRKSSGYHPYHRPKVKAAYSLASKGGALSESCKGGAL